MRRRIILMRHAQVAYFDAHGRPVSPDDVSLTPQGEEQAEAAGRLLAPVGFNRVIISGLPRTRQTAQRVLGYQNHAPAVEEWPALRELRGGRLSDIPNAELQASFLGAFSACVPESTRFLGGETIGALFDRVLPAMDELLSSRDWDTSLLVLHGGVNCAILSYALTGGRLFLGNLAQAPACINVLDAGANDWVVRGVNLSPSDWLYESGRSTTMEELFERYLKHRNKHEHTR